MPFESEAQRKWMHANDPEMAKRWEKHTPKGKKLPKKVEKEAAYTPPYGIDRLKRRGSALLNCPIHKWRAEQGIELIHQEPDLAELQRIWGNWQEMTPEQKELSEARAMELFGLTNKAHYEKLLPLYQEKEAAYNHTFVTGLPGAGKTTLAQELAKTLGKDMISLDTVPGMNDTDDTTALSLSTIDGLDRDSVVEGAQLLGVPRDYFKDKDYRVLHAPNKMLVDRLVSRGFEDTPGGELIQGDNPENKARARKFLRMWRQMTKKAEQSTKVYHGSAEKLDTLEPRDLHGDPDVGKAVFATPYKQMALAYLGNRWGDRDIEQGSTDGEWALKEMRPGAFKEIYPAGRIGYLHELLADSFKRPARSIGDDFEVISEAAVTPQRVSKISNIRRALQRAGVKLVKYEDAVKGGDVDRATTRMAGRLGKMDAAEAAEYLTWVSETNQTLRKAIEDKHSQLTKKAADPITPEVVKQKYTTPGGWFGLRKPTLDMAGVMRNIYPGAGNLEGQIAQADKYNRENNIPFQMSTYLTSKPKIVASDTAGYSALDNKISVPDSLTNSNKTDPLSRVINGFDPRKRVDTSTYDSTLRHEMAHAATLQPGSREWLQQRSGTNPERYASEDFVSTYPEISAAEYVPPLSALQQHLYQTTGSRITAPAGYDSFVAPYTGVEPLELESKIESLPREVQRLLRYRNTMERGDRMGRPLQGPTPDGTTLDRARINRYDQLNRKLVPGLVQAQPTLTQALKQAALSLDIEIGDTLLMGKFKNSPQVVEEIGTDELGQPTINGKKALTFRIKKTMPTEKQAMSTAFRMGKWLGKQAGDTRTSPAPIKPSKRIKAPSTPISANAEPFNTDVPLRVDGAGPMAPKATTLPAPSMQVTPEFNTDNALRTERVNPTPTLVSAPQQPRASTLARMAVPGRISDGPLVAGR